MSTWPLEFGLDSFGEVSTESSGRLLSDADTVRLMIEEAQLAESVGIDIFSIGEHYRHQHVDSAGPIVLATIAGRTGRIRLGTSVTVLSIHDPVRLYADFASLDAASNGRAQLIVGRASSPEGFPLFGFDLADYEVLFEEKLDLFAKLLREQPVTWSGTVRSPLTEQYVLPAIAPGAIPTWVGVGGSPQSVIRAARFGFPLMLAVIFGSPDNFKPHVEIYRRALEQYGQTPQPIGMHSLGFVAKSDEEADALYWPQWDATMKLVSAQRGFARPTRRQFEADVSHGALFVGSPETVATKIATSVRTLGLGRFDLKYEMARLSREHRATSIELFGREVIPMVRQMLAENPPKPAAAGDGAIALDARRNRG